MLLAALEELSRPVGGGPRRPQADRLPQHDLASFLSMPVPLDLLDPGRGDPCVGCSHTAILVTFAAPQGRADAEGDHVPLRCGRPDVGRQEGWGYRHFANRWAGRARSFGEDVATTLRAGRRERANRGTVRYEHVWFTEEGVVDREMTVVVSLRAQQPDGGIRGIITAFWWDRPELAQPALSRA